MQRIRLRSKMPLPTCPVCNEYVELEKSNSDEDGHAIHEECYLQKVRSKGASQVQQIFLVSQSMNAAAQAPESTVRCPYCVEDGAFKAMIGNHGQGHVCGRCGHIRMSSHKSFPCLCPKCSMLRLQHSGNPKNLPIAVQCHSLFNPWPNEQTEQINVGHRTVSAVWFMGFAVS